ncbi:MAG TPA: poly(3-hydroxyalkanoate) granule-associated protein PhaI [Pseudomonas xinjiangensis]|uniref:Poly(3-hydroxyalkanoate) granule-associated protein PhaI n=2 Tax=root TaxID=1 RepID=A0A7V1BP70_9GAMM|nr:poly(3-hydroxyalkanoate) granule-associated protein PhaI [Halopseudomonas xinjiangensis]HEC48345.1 poly(3-hydroxyalkanoate) granule-associated protein PhaI [Halopseudomonas xinjiangensis]
MAKVDAVKAEENALSFASDVRNYAHQIWLAGLGAYAKAGKDGAEYFKSLVSEGEELEKQGKELVSERVEAVSSKVESFKERVQARAGGRFNKVEQVFDERVASALSRMGIPSKKDIDQLSAKLDLLSASLKSMQNK